MLLRRWRRSPRSSSATSKRITPMPHPVELKGRAASGGRFIGPILRIGTPARPRKRRSSSPDERSALAAAIASAIADIAGLTGKIEDAGGEMLAFQIAMLEDEALSAPAFAAIDSGISADEAWSEALDSEIGG